MSPSVVIIILQYNNSSDTIRCLNSIKTLEYPNFKLLVVDNNSKTSELETVQKYLQDQWPNSIPHVLLENKKNIGYARGNNVGIREALKQGADYLFILNNDTTISSDALTKLIAVAEADPQVGIVGPAIEEPGRKIYYGKISWLHSELSHIDKPPVGLYLKPKDYLPGAALLIKKGVIEKIGNLDEIFFLYFEDADFCFRAQLAGYKLKVVPEATIQHQVSASTKKMGVPLILRYHMRNALIFNSLNAPWTIKPFLIFWAGWVLFKNMLKLFIWPDQDEIPNALINGVLDFYKNHFGPIIPKTPS